MEHLMLDECLKANRPILDEQDITDLSSGKFKTHGYASPELNFPIQIMFDKDPDLSTRYSYHLNKPSLFKSIFEMCKFTM
jgi:hypothetical protein